MLQVRRRRFPSVSTTSSSSSSPSSSLDNNIVNLEHSPRRPSQPFVRTESRHPRHLQSRRQVLSGLLRSPSLLTTDFGWLDSAAPTPRLNASRSVTDFRPVSDRGVLPHSSLNTIQESADRQTTDLHVTSLSRLRSYRDPVTRKSEKAGILEMEKDKENVGPRPLHSTSGHLTKVGNSTARKNVPRDTSRILLSSLAASSTLSPSREETEDVDGLYVGDVSSGSASCRRALIPASCTIAADDDTGPPATDFRRGLTRRSFTLPKIRSRFSLKVGGLRDRIGFSVQFNSVYFRQHGP